MTSSRESAASRTRKIRRGGFQALALQESGSLARGTALDGARQQETLSWELRAATSLARLLRNRGRPSDAMAVLQPVYDRFTEAFDTADLKTARTLLDTLQ
jgi:predicted ATPase